MRGSAAALFLLVALGGLRPVSATTVVALEVEDLAREADRAVQGTVQAVEARRVDGRVHTLVTVQVQEDLFGAPGESAPTVTLRLRGGVDGEVGESIPGTPRLAVGDALVVFLARSRGDPEVHHLVGLAQSVWHIQPGPEGPVVVRDLEGLARARRVDGGWVLQESGLTEAPLSLEDLKARVRAARAP